MSATRTQIYLTETQRARIDEIANSEGLTMAEVIRRALDSYLTDEFPDPGPALTKSFGAIPGASIPDRDEWTRG